MGLIFNDESGGFERYMAEYEGIYYCEICGSEITDGSEIRLLEHFYVHKECWDEYRGIGYCDICGNKITDGSEIRLQRAYNDFEYEYEEDDDEDKDDNIEHVCVHKACLKLVKSPVWAFLFTESEV